MKLLNDTQTLPENMSFRQESLGEVINLVNNNKISRDSAKKVLKAVFNDNVIPEDYVKENNMQIRYLGYQRRYRGDYCRKSKGS